MRRASRGEGERSIGAASRTVRIVLALALAAHVAWQAAVPAPVAGASALPRPPATAYLRAVSFGEPIAMANAVTLYLQAFDNQPGISIPYAELDYEVVRSWLALALELDPRAQYPLLMAAQLYAQVPDERKTRVMLDFVHEQFLRDPERRWRWLAHASIIAKHRLHDMPLALRYAQDITKHAGSAYAWARQMHIFILQDMGEVEAATVLLGGLLASGEVTDEREIRLLTERLDELKGVENSSGTSKTR
jgi:hypothetical protein